MLGLRPNFYEHYIKLDHFPKVLKQKNKLETTAKYSNAIFHFFRNFHFWIEDFPWRFWNLNMLWGHSWHGCISAWIHIHDCCCPVIRKILEGTLDFFWGLKSSMETDRVLVECGILNIYIYCAIYTLWWIYIHNSLVRFETHWSYETGF